MPTDPTEPRLGSRIDHTRMDSRSKTAIAPQRRQSILVVADFAPAARTFPISPLNPAAPKPPDKPRLHCFCTQSVFQLCFRWFSPKIEVLRRETEPKSLFFGQTVELE